MEVAPNPIAIISSGTKSPEADCETPTKIQPTGKLSPFSNGVLKRHSYAASQPVKASPVSYKECLKNHAASIGAHALDGCGEFMPSPSAASSDPFSLKCAACGCHRNFHRREPEDQPLSSAISTHVIEYQPHHRHHPPPPLHPPSNRSPNSSSPPPISSSYYPSAPHMLLALSAGLSVPPENSQPMISPTTGRKRFRTKFSQDQKEKMHQFAEKLGWKFQKKDEELVRQFCNEIGVEKGVLKVWIHNNKNTFAKKDVNGERTILQNSQNNGNNYEENAVNHHNLVQNPNHYHSDGMVHFGTNGSSSSS